MAEPVKRPSINPLKAFRGLTGAARPNRLHGLSNWQFTAGSAVLGLALAAGAVLAMRPLGLGSA